MLSAVPAAPSDCHLALPPFGQKTALGDRAAIRHMSTEAADVGDGQLGMLETCKKFADKSFQTEAPVNTSHASTAQNHERARADDNAPVATPIHEPEVLGKPCFSSPWRDAPQAALAVHATPPPFSARHPPSCRNFEDIMIVPVRTVDPRLRPRPTAHT